MSTAALAGKIRRAAVGASGQVGRRRLAALGDGYRTTAAWLSRRAVPILASLALLASGMAYSLVWAPVVRHHPYWVTPGPIWDTYRSTEELIWGNFGGIYALHPALVTFPGILFVLAPCVWLSRALGLHGAFPFSVAYPGSWLLVGPYSILVASSALFAVDRMMREAGVQRERRVAASVITAAVLFPVVVLWGHPEDALAVALVAWALSASLGGRGVAAAWLAGLAIAVQPLVLLVVALVVLRELPRRWPGMLTRMALPAVALLVVPLAAHFHRTWQSISAQPNYPAIDHPTPLLALASRLAPERFAGAVRLVATGHGIRELPAHLASQPVVAAGPLRSAALACALCVALAAWRWRGEWLDDPASLVWLGALAFGLRIVFEPVMDPFYVWPALSFVVLAAGLRGSWVRLGAVGVLAVLVSVISEWRASPWAYWVPIVALLALALAAVAPRGVPSSERVGRQAPRAPA